ncbi:MAG: hypothetical protein WED11_04175, partial [Natronospirillum sp.]
THRTDVTLSQNDHHLRDRLALSFSDLVIAFMDGQEPYPMRSGTALLVKDALMRRKPVIWVDVCAADQEPECLMSEPSKLTDTALTELQVLGATPQLMRTLFSPVVKPDITNNDDICSLDHQLELWFRGLLTPFLAATNIDSAEQRMRNRIRRQSSLLGFVRAWVTYCWFTLTGNRQRTTKPLTLLQYVRGSVLWLRVMLDPPRRSPGLQILDFLTTELREFTWRENAVSRLHGFFSNLVKLNPRGAWRGLRQPVVRHQNDHTMPAHQPIIAVPFKSTFAWADSQARFFATRHRDDTWVIYYAAATAVFCAVAGALHLWPSSVAGWNLFWVILEVVLLRFIVGKVLV